MEEITPSNTDPDTKTMQRQDKPPRAGMSGATILEQIDPSTLQVIRQLFTEPGNGLTFLTLILCFAEVKQIALPGIEGTTDVAVISIQNIYELAQKIKWGYDTTHKYVVIFCALNLLTKRRSEGRIQLLFSLQQYAPPSTLQALDKLIENSRPKVRQFAVRVKHRCILYNIIPHNQPKQEEHSTHEQQLLLQLQSILQDEQIGPTKRQRLVTRISSEIISKLLTSSSTSESHAPPDRRPAEQEKAEHEASSQTVKPSPSSPIVEKMTYMMHEPTPDQIDISIIERAAHMHEPTPDQMDTVMEETLMPYLPSETEEEEMEEEEYETSSAEEQKSESTRAEDLVSVKEALREIFSSPTTKKSSDKKPPAGTARTYQQYSQRRENSTIQPDTFRKPVEQPEASKKDSQNLRVDSHSPRGNSLPSASGEHKSGWVDYLAHTPLPGKNKQPEPRTSTQEKSTPERVDTQEVVSPTHSPIEEKEHKEAVSTQEKSTSEEKSTRQSAEAGDSQKNEVDFSAITQIGITGYSPSFLRAYVTFNVIEFINNNYKNNVNVTSRDELAKFLSEILDGDRGKWLIYKKKFGECGPDAIVGALIFTLTSLYDRGGESIANKAALFIKRCREYQADGIPPDIVMLTKSLGHYTFEGMIKFFKDRQQLVKDPRSMGQEPVTPVKQYATQGVMASTQPIGLPQERGVNLVKQGNRLVTWRSDKLGTIGPKKKRHIK